MLALIASCLPIGFAHAKGGGAPPPPPPPPSPWQVILLQPSFAKESYAYGGSVTQQVGYGYTSNWHALLWNSSAASGVDLNPAGVSQSFLFGVGDGQQVGSTAKNFVQMAALWRGTPASYVSLHPSGASSSTAYAVSGTQQVGVTSFPSDPPGDGHASLWTGTAASWIDLYPGGHSGASAVSAGVQVGTIVIPAVPGSPRASHAALWRGTPESLVDLHPLVAGVLGSGLSGVSGDWQVGQVAVGSAPETAKLHASLWRGSSESWVDLHPAHWDTSTALAIDDGYQAGYVQPPFVFGVSSGHACVWNGNAPSFYDLHILLPSDYGNGYSYATGISHDATTIYVTGMAYNTKTKKMNAVLWVRPRVL